MRSHVLSFYHSVSKFRTLKRQLTSISRLKDKARLLSSEVQVKHRMEIQKFEGVGDRFKGVTVISKDEHCNVENLEQRLESSLTSWQEEGLRCVWFLVSPEHSDWIPILTKNGFKFHNATEERLALMKWIGN